MTKKQTTSIEILQEIQNLNKKFMQMDKNFMQMDKNFTNKFAKLENNLGIDTEYKAKSYFKNVIKKGKIGNQKFDYYIANKEIRNKDKILTEIDLILVNGKYLGIVETKTTLDPKDIEKFFNKTLVEFKKLDEIDSRKENQPISIKNKTCIPIFACRFINKLNKIQDYKKDKNFYIYQEETYNTKFKLIETI